MRKWDYNVERGRGETRNNEKQVTNEGRGKSNEEDGGLRRNGGIKRADKGMEKKKALEDESEGENEIRKIKEQVGLKENRKRRAREKTERRRRI